MNQFQLISSSRDQPRLKSPRRPYEADFRVVFVAKLIRDRERWNYMPTGATANDQDTGARSCGGNAV